jgi:hypothetical protein
VRRDVGAALTWNTVWLRLMRGMLRVLEGQASHVQLFSHDCGCVDEWTERQSM